MVTSILKEIKEECKQGANRGELDPHIEKQSSYANDDDDDNESDFDHIFIRPLRRLSAVTTPGSGVFLDTKAINRQNT